MGTLTTNYSFHKPTDGGDDDTWGNGYLIGFPGTDPSPGLNGNWAKADFHFKDFQDRIDALDTALGDVPQKLKDAEIKVGQLLIVTWEGNPATVLGYGTWAAWNAGRTLVGVGDNGKVDWATPGMLRGADTVTLTAAQLPAHAHDYNPPSDTSSSSGSHNHGTVQGASSGNPGGSGSASTVRTGAKTTASAGSHSHSVSVTFSTNNIGSGGAHNNIQPSKAAYIWQRIS